MTQPPVLDDRLDALLPSRVSRGFFWIITLGVLGLLIWAALAEVDQTIRGTGRVISSSELQVVTSLEAGVLETILVRPGETVSQGQPLLRLDPTQSGAELGAGRITTQALEMKVARLSAEVAGRAPRYPAPADAQGAGLLAAERALYASRQASLRNLLVAGDAQRRQAQQAVAASQAALAAAQTEAAQAQSELATIAPLVDSGIEPRLSLTRAQAEVARTRSAAAQAQAALGREQARIAQVNADTVRIRQDWREQAASELAAAQAELGARGASLPALEERLERTVLRAPVAGTVSRVLVTTSGSAVAPGEPLVELVAKEEQLLVEARIAPQDIGNVRIGQPAKVGITAYDQTIYGALDGTVTTISPDSIQDPQTGELYYLVRIATQRNGLTGRGERELAIGPGMVANVSLLGDKRTVLEYILTPITRLQETAFRE